MEFDKYYRRFLLPFRRGSEDRGRAKGYAGILVTPDREYLDIVGMEAARIDWTDLARGLQRDLLHRLFYDSPPEEIEDSVRRWVKSVRTGKKDHALIYRKQMKKKLSEYTKSSPPHVKAARLSPKPHGMIRYVMTTAGPQPVGYETAPLDYEHYVKKQILPIVQTIAQVCGIDVDYLISGERGLFTGLGNQ